MVKELSETSVRRKEQELDGSEGTGVGLQNDEIEIPVNCYPIESITRFELKSTQTPGWTIQENVDYIIRRACVISLAVPLSPHPPSTIPSLARLIYTGGYVLPGAPDPAPVDPDHPPQRLPADLENAMVEQVASWFINREKPGQIRTWPAGEITSNWPTRISSQASERYSSVTPGYNSEPPSR